jgi:hypothetical protein
MNPSCFQKIRFVDSFCRLIFKRFDLFLRILRILSTIAQNVSLKIKIRESGFVNLNPKDSYRGFVSCKQKSQITRFVLIRIRIPHPYNYFLNHRTCGDTGFKLVHNFYLWQIFIAGKNRSDCLLKYN